MRIHTGEKHTVVRYLCGKSFKATLLLAVIGKSFAEKGNMRVHMFSSHMKSLAI